MTQKSVIAFVLGIRPDIIRAASILNILKQESKVDTVLIWSGQHYSDNLKGVFFKELGIEKPDYELNCEGSNDSIITSELIKKLYPVLVEIKPIAVVFLGDTNTTAGALACAQLNIPIVHIEGCMRSYDWEMPEEKYRTSIDHLSDVIYAYLDEYKQQGVREGLNPANIVVTGNPIVDILEKYYFSRVDYFDKMATPDFFAKRGLKKGEYFVMTCHRRENINTRESLGSILNLCAASPLPIFFPAGYRTQQYIKEFNFNLPDTIKLIDPIGYEELLTLMVNSKGVITDSGTIVEEACILNVPCIQMRRSTERPQVYDVGACVKYNPHAPTPPDQVFRKLEKIQEKKWQQPFGNGNSSKIIAEDLIQRALNDGFRRHRPNDYHLDISKSYSGEQF